MTRKEEINEQCFVNGFNDHDKEIFTIGAEWADSRPRKGLADIEKVCKWLLDNTVRYDIQWLGRVMVNDMVKDLRKAMEEQIYEE